MAGWQFLINGAGNRDMRSVSVLSTIAGAQKFEVNLRDVTNINTLNHFDDVEIWAPATSPPGGLIFDGVGSFIELTNTLEMDSDNWSISWWMKRQVPWLTGYSARKQIALTGHASGEQTDYQIKLDVEYDPIMKSNFDDIRFTMADGATPLYAWLESKTDSQDAKIVVKTNTPADGTTAYIYMYYGNSSASPNWDIDNTFVFADDFNNDLSKWTIAGGTWSIYDGKYLSGIPGGSESIIYSTNYNSFEDNIIECEWWFSNWHSGNSEGILTRLQDPSNYYATLLTSGNNTGNEKSIMVSSRVGGVWQSNNYVHQDFTNNKWYHFGASNLNDTLAGYLEGEEKVNMIKTDFSSGRIGFRLWESEIVINNVRVSKYILYPATYLIGNKEDAPANIIPEYTCIFSYGKNGVSGHIEIGKTDNHIRIESKTNSAWIVEMDTRIDTSDGEWHHYVLVFAAADTKLYVDNILTDTETPNTDTDTFDIKYFGHQQDRTTYIYGSWFAGSLADVRIYDSAIDIDEVVRLSVGTYILPCKAFYTLNQSSAEDDAIYDRFEGSHGTSYIGATTKGALTVDTSPLNQFISFKGRIETVVPDYDTNTISIAGRDYISEMLSRAVVESYGNPTPILRSVMVNDMVLKYGKSMTRGNIDDSPAGTEIEYLFKTSAWDAIIKCSKDDGYKFFVDTDKDFHYHIKGWRESEITIEVGVDDILTYNILESGSEVINMVTVFGHDDGTNQIIVMGEDLSSQTYYGIINEKRIVDLNIMTESDAENFAYKYLEDHAYVLEIIEIDLLGYETLIPGDLVTLKMQDININGSYLIVDKLLKYPSGITTIKVAKYAKHLEAIIGDMVEKILMLERYFIEEGSTVLRLHRVNESILYTDRVVIEKRGLDDSFKIGVNNQSTIGTTRIGGRGGEWQTVHDSGY